MSSIAKWGSASSSSNSASWSRASRAEYPASSRNGRQVASSPASSASASSLDRAWGRAGAAKRTQAELSSNTGELTSARAGPAAPAHFLGRGRVEREIAAADALRQARAAGGDALALGPDARELLLGAEDEQLRELDPLAAELAAQLVQRRADGRRLGDRVTGMLGRDAHSVTPVWHRPASPRPVASEPMTCFIAPPDLLAYVIEQGEPAEREAALRTIAASAALRTKRQLVG